MVRQNRTNAQIVELDRRVGASRHRMHQLQAGSKRSERRRVNARVFVDQNAQALYLLVRSVAGGLGDALHLHWKPDTDVALATDFSRLPQDAGNARERDARRHRRFADVAPHVEDRTAHQHEAARLFPHADDLTGRPGPGRPAGIRRGERIPPGNPFAGGRMGGRLGHRLPLDERYTVHRWSAQPDEEHPDEPLPADRTDFTYFATYGPLLGDEMLSALRLAVANIRSMDNGRYRDVKLDAIVRANTASVRLAQLIENLIVRRRQHAGRIWPRRETLELQTTSILCAYEYFRNGPVDPEIGV